MMRVVRKMVGAAVALVILWGASFARAQVVVERGYRVQEVAGSAGLGPVAAVSEDELIAAAGFFGNQRLVRLDVHTGLATDFVLGVTDTNGDFLLDGGISSVGDLIYDATYGHVYFTDNYSHGTVFVAVDINGNVRATDVIALPEGGVFSEVRPLVPRGSIPFAGNILQFRVEAQRTQRQSSLGAGASGNSILVGNAAGGGAGTVVAINEDTGAMSVYATGLDFTAGLDRHPLTGEVYVGSSSFPSPGKIYRLIGDQDQDGQIHVSDTDEAQLVVSAIGGPNDLLFGGDGTLYVSTASSEVFQIVDTDNDQVPDQIRPLASGFSFSGSMDLSPPGAALVVGPGAGTLFVSDPFAFGAATPTIKAIQKVPTRQMFILSGFGPVQVLSR